MFIVYKILLPKERRLSKLDSILIIQIEIIVIQTGHQQIAIYKGNI
jgi:hypothetical protein